MQPAEIKPASVETLTYAMPLAAVKSGQRQGAWTAGWFVGATVKNLKVAGKLSLAPTHAPCPVVSICLILSCNVIST